MTMKRSVSWFLTDRGRKFSHTVITATGIAITAAKFTPQTLFIDKYKDFVHYYRNGQPVKLTEELHQRCQKCLDTLNLPDIHRKLVAPFSVFGYDLWHAGTLNSKFGASIGIPINFTYKSVEDVEKDEVQVNRNKLDLTSQNGIKLANALILPEKVQEFAICREILMTRGYKVMYEAGFPFACLFTAYNLSHYLNKRLNLYAGPVYLRATMYGIVCLFFTGIYFLLQDTVEVYYETEVDKKLCELGPDFIESGVVFYDKILQRNQALRELMGREGENKYSKLGNENFGLRQPRTALYHRKQFFEEKLKEYKKKQEELSHAEQILSD